MCDKHTPKDKVQRFTPWLILTTDTVKTPYHNEMTLNYADRQMVMRSMAQLLQISKASEEDSIQRL